MYCSYSLVARISVRHNFMIYFSIFVQMSHVYVSEFNFIESGISENVCV